MVHYFANFVVKRCMDDACCGNATLCKTVIKKIMNRRKTSFQNNKRGLGVHLLPSRLEKKSILAQGEESCLEFCRLHSCLELQLEVNVIKYLFSWK